MTIFLHHPKKWLVLIALITIALLQPLSRLVPDNSLGVWFYEEDNYFKNYSRFKNTFGNDANITLLYENDQLFSRSQLELNRKLTSSLGSLNNVKSVLSLTNIETIQLDGLSFVTGLLIPERASNLESIEQEARTNPIVSGHLISEDGTVTTLVLNLVKDDDESSKQTVRAVKDILAEPEFAGNEYHVFGGLAILAEMNDLSNRESGLFVSLMIAVAILLLILIFGSVRFGLYPVVIALISMIWTTALYSINHSINLVSGIMPLIIIVISIADSVHIIFDYRSFRNSGLRKRQAIHAAINKLFKPCLFTSLTTAIAFMAFNFSTIPPLQSLGRYTGIGVMIAFALSFSLLPILLFLFEKDNAQYEAKKRGPVQNKWDKRLGTLHDFIALNKKPIVAIGLLCMLFAVYGMTKLQFETDQIRYFKPTHPVRLGHALAQERFEGIFPLEIVIESKTKGFFYQTKNLKWVHELENKILQQEPVRRTVSLFNYHKRLLEIRKQNELPEVPTRIQDKILAKFVNTYPDFVSSFLSADGDKIRLSVRSRWLDNQELINLIKDIENILDPMVNRNNTTYFMTGHVEMFASINTKLVESQVSSFLICFVVIFTMLLLLARKISLAILGMIPNLLPLILTLGIIGWLGIKLDVATVMIAALSLGIAVDDSVHLIHNYIKKRKQGSSRDVALKFSIKETGGPISLTTLILIVGFSVMLFSSFLPIFYFGIFFSLNVLFAIIGDLVILPAILMTFKDKREQRYGRIVKSNY